MPTLPDFDALIATLLQPVSPAQPCGVPLRHEPEYDQIQDARRQDDPDLPVGIWQSSVKTADWRAVEQLCTDALQKRGKDLMVAGWLAEAWVQRYGLSGWIKGIELMATLCERYWAGLHPQAVDGDESWRTAPLDWMLRTFAEALRFRVPLLDQAADVTLAIYQGWQRQSVCGTERRAEQDAARLASKALERYQTVVRAESPATLQGLSQTLRDSKMTLGAFEALCDRQMHNDAPSFGAVQRVLDELLLMLDGLDDVLPWKGVNKENDMTEPTIASAGPAAAATPLPSPSGVVNGREDAYRQLQAIATYLAQVEPHSPVPYLINRAVEWGRRPLPELLSELIESDSEARRVWSLIGVLP
ncbi:type VI secretion system protein TssA [Jeongeupia naejangsanensis]|uniref:Type VI secretion system protein TssA n=1 Tax=Jeongeupia naejangsanensis TaxID=613195 RepID=A0ABS2BQ26_9NEIS|nr:type VI secretion system protein TssA [Jeongeupia naejangsanensis]MBM3117673.1 type VI secretion system protein TssA [Jeongeupia naejangsanensis]